MILKCFMNCPSSVLNESLQSRFWKLRQNRDKNGFATVEKILHSLHYLIQPRLLFLLEVRILEPIFFSTRYFRYEFREARPVSLLFGELSLSLVPWWLLYGKKNRNLSWTDTLEQLTEERSFNCMSMWWQYRPTFTTVSLRVRMSIITLCLHLHLSKLNTQKFSAIELQRMN